MYHRLLSWLFLCAFAAVFTLRAQTPPVANQPGQIRVIKVAGQVTQTLNSVSTPLQLNDLVPQAARINTGVGASVVLAFSNGAQTQLGEDTELVIDQFIQDPFADSVAATIADEPTRSATKLTLNKGELVGKVAKLKHDTGSTFTIQTPVGAAGIRGTTFRIVFRPSGTGLAFFQLSTVEGDVGFAPQGNTPPGTPPPPGTPTAAVTDGQEVTVTVTVTITPTGQIVVTAPPQIVTTVPISPQNLASIVTQVQAIATVLGLTPPFIPGGSTGAPPPAPPPPTPTPAPEPPTPTPPPPRITSPDGTL